MTSKITPIALMGAVALAACAPVANTAAPDRTSPTPASSAAPPSSAAPTPGTEPLAVLDPGTYTTTNFAPAISYTVPAGWALVDDSADGFTIVPAAFPYTSVHVCRDPQAGSATGQKVDLVANSAQDLATWLADRPELGRLSGPTDFELGGLSGFWFDFQGPSGGPDDVNVVGYEGGNDCRINIHPDQRLRLAFLDAPDATLMAYIRDTVGGELVNIVTDEIVLSFVFDVP